MGLGGILFNPNGRINASEFWRGLIVLIAASIVLNVASVYGPIALSLILGLVSLLFIYPYICLFGKRLHDANRSAWWFLAFLAGAIIASFIGGFLMQSVIPGQAEFTEEIEELSQSGDFNAVLELTREQSRSLMIPSIISSTVISLIIGWFAARLPSEPGPNQYGPPTDGSALADDTFS
ncbi:MAG: DUF805 domain-containing protein [Pseudomonadota bacterium]